MSQDLYINASKTSSLKNTKKYYGNYLGIVIQNNDPEKSGKIKVWVPHISPSVYLKWTESNEDKSFKFIGKNINSDITDIVEDLKGILPWAVCAAPLNGTSGSGRYNAYTQNATISDSNNINDHNFNESYTKTKYSLNNDGIGEKPGRKYELNNLKVNDAFTDASETPFENANKYGYNYVPSTYSNSAKGSFSIPNVGSHVWVFFDDGDPNSPVYFAVSHGSEDWKSIYQNNSNPGVDYPGSFENKNSGLQDYNHNTETYRNKYVINQKGGTFEIVNTDNKESLKFTHFSGSFKELNNYVNIEFAVNNDQKLVIGDQFETIRGHKNEYTQRDYDSICIGDKYTKIGNQKFDIFKQYKDLLDNVADAKQLFEIKRAKKIETEQGFFKKTSAFQTQDGTFGPCPLCKDTNRHKIWDNKYEFGSIVHQSYNSSKSAVNFDDVTSTNDNTSALLVLPNDTSDMLGSGSCPVCDGTGYSPSTFNGEWAKEEKDEFVIEKLKVINNQLVDLEKEMGMGGNEIVSITKNKYENIGLVFNDFPSIRVDDSGKIDIDQVLVFNKGVSPTFAKRSLFEYVHVDDLPGGSLIQNVNNKWNVQVGAGGVSIKTVGGLDIGGAITNVVGQQTNIVSEEEINIDAKVVNIAAEMLMLRNKNKKQVVVDGNLGVKQNIVVGGAMHVEGELSVQHITAPVEIQETEAITLFSKLLGGLKFRCRISNHSRRYKNKGTCTITLLSDSNDDKVKAYPHTHPFKNLPLKLMKNKDDVRKIGQAANEDFPGAAIPVIHEDKGPEEID